MRPKYTLILLVTIFILSSFTDINATDARDDMNTGGDAVGTFSGSPSIVLIEGQLEGTGYLDTEDSDDVYALTVGFHKEVYVEMTPPAGTNFDLYMYVQYEWSRPASVSENGVSEVESVVYTSAGGILGAESETVWIKVSRKSGSGMYKLAISVTETIVQDDMGSGGDAGDEIGEATEIEPGSGNGYEWSGDRYDFYKIDVMVGQTVECELTSNTGDFDLHLYDHNQLRVDIESYQLSDDIPATVTWTATSPGYFYVEVRLMRSQGTYSMTVERTGNEPPDASFDFMVEGGTIMLTDLSFDWDGDVVEYHWYWDGELLEEYLEEPVIIWEDIPEGEYQITLIVVDDKGAESEPYTQTVTVVHQLNQPPEAKFEWWVEDYILEVDGRSSNDSDGEIVEYRWYLDGEIIEGSLDWEGWTWEGLERGVYEISLIVVDDQGAESEPFTLEIEIEESLNRPPEAIFSWYLEGGTLFVDASGSSDDGEIMDYVWFVDGVEDESLGGMVSWEWADIGAGSYDITLRVYDEAGEEDMYRTTVLIEGDSDRGFEIPGFPMLSVMVGLLVGAIILSFRNFLHK
jgi:PKD repeat protein